MANIVQNTDTFIQLTILDADSVPVTISTLSEYEVYLYQIVNNEKIKVANYKSSNTGIYTIDVVDDALGIVSFVFNRQISNNTNAGTIYAEVRLRESASSIFIDSLKNSGSNGIVVGNLVTTSNRTSLQ